MKKIVFAAFVLALMLALSVFAYADEGTFNPSLDVTEEENKITVVIEDNPVFAEYEPKLTIPCEGWFGAEVTLGGEAIDSVFEDEAVTFTVASGGTYVIDRIYPYVPPAAYYSLTFETNGGSEIAALRITENSVVDLEEYVPRRNGHTFLGWFSDAAMTEEITSAQMDGNKVVYAKWALDFTDVDAGAYYHDAVIWAIDNGITEGTSDTTFSPYHACTRAEMVTFLWRAAGSPAPESETNPFNDVSKDAYYYEAVLWSVERGITVGTSADTFSPNNACTRGQMAAFLYRYAGSPAASGDNAFEDVHTSAYYYDAVLWAAQEGITNGISEAAFAPKDICTRCQIVTFLYRCDTK